MINVFNFLDTVKISTGFYAGKIGRVIQYDKKDDLYLVRFKYLDSYTYSPRPKTTIGNASVHVIPNYEKDYAWIKADNLVLHEYKDGWIWFIALASVAIPAVAGMIISKLVKK